MESLLRQLKVLYVEDDLVHRQELADYLSRRVGRLYLAENGEQGLEKFSTLKPDLIITDLRMPKLSGIEMAREIRKENKIVPIIILTAMSDKESILESVKFGILDYVIKPVDVKELIAVMERAASALTVIDHDFGQIHYAPEKLNKLKSMLTAYIKKETGKGPVDIRFEDSEQNLMVTIVGALTKFELALLTSESNRSLVEYNRGVFFKDRIRDLEEMVCETVQSTALKLYDIQVDVERDRCILLFKR